MPPKRPCLLRIDLNKSTVLLRTNRLKECEELARGATVRFDGKTGLFHLAVLALVASDVRKSKHEWVELKPHREVIANLGYLPMLREAPAINDPWAALRMFWRKDVRGINLIDFSSSFMAIDDAGHACKMGKAARGGFRDLLASEGSGRHDKLRLRLCLKDVGIRPDEISVRGWKKLLEQARSLRENHGPAEKDQVARARASVHRNVLSYLERAAGDVRLQAPCWYVEGATIPFSEKEPTIGREARPIEEEGSNRAQPVLSVLRQTKGLGVLLGDSGSGKTSALQAYFEELRVAALSNRQAAIPILIDLTDACASAERLVREQVKQFEAGRDGGMKNLERPLVLLFDGLDRLASNSRPGNYIRGIGALARAPSVVKVIVTSKTTDWADTWLAGMSTPIWGMVGFRHDGKEVEAYFRKRFGPKARRFHKQLLNEWRLADLVRNPLMLRLVVDLLEADPSGATLQTRKARIFEEWVTTKLQLQDDPFPEWYETAFPLLCRIAYLGLSQGQQQIERKEVAEAYEGLKWKDSRERDLLQLAKDAGILRSSGLSARGDKIEFTHQLFQEYFASLIIRQDLQAAADTGEFLVKLLEWTKWDEAALMAFELIDDETVLLECLMTLLGYDMDLAARALARRMPLTRTLSEPILERLSELCREEKNQYAAVRCMCCFPLDLVFDPLVRLIERADDWVYLHWNTLSPLSADDKAAIYEHFVNHKSDELRWGAVYYWVAFYPSDCQELLLEYLHTEEVTLLDGIVRGLERLGSDRAVDALRSIVVKDGIRSSSFVVMRAVHAMALMENPRAQVELGAVLSDKKTWPTARWSLAGTALYCDPAAQWQLRLRGIVKRFLADSSNDRKAVVRFYRDMVSRYRRRYHPPLFGAAFLRCLREAVTDDDGYYLGPTADPPGIRDVAWFYLQRARMLGQEDDEWEALRELFEDPDSSAELKRDFISAMAWVSPGATTEYVIPMLKAAAPIASWAIHELGQSSQALPQECCEPVFDALLRGDIYTSMHRSVLNKLPKSRQTFRKLSKVVLNCSEEVLAGLVETNLVWPDRRVADAFERRIESASSRDAECAAAVGLAYAGGHRGLKMLLDDIEGAVRKTDVAWLAGDCSSSTYRDLVDSLARYHTISKNRQYLASVIADIIRCTPKAHRNDAIEAVRRSYPPDTLGLVSKRLMGNEHWRCPQFVGT